MCNTTFYVTSPTILVVYKVYYIVRYVTFPTILVVYKVYYIVLCYITESTGCIDVVLHRSMLHPPGYWYMVYYILVRCSTPYIPPVSSGMEHRTI